MNKFLPNLLRLLYNEMKKVYSGVINRTNNSIGESHVIITIGAEDRNMNKIRKNRVRITS